MREETQTGYSEPTEYDMKITVCYVKIRRSLYDGLLRKQCFLIIPSQRTTTETIFKKITRKYTGYRETVFLKRNVEKTTGEKRQKKNNKLESFIQNTLNKDDYGDMKNILAMYLAMY